MTVPGVLGVELMPDWLHPSPQIISKFGGDRASLPRDPHLGAWAQHLSLPSRTQVELGGLL